MATQVEGDERGHLQNGAKRPPFDDFISRQAVDNPASRLRGDYASTAVDQDFSLSLPGSQVQCRFDGADQRPSQDEVVVVQVRDLEIVHFAVPGPC
jgi:hypothetical protein